MTTIRLSRLAIFLVLSLAANAALVSYVALRPSAPASDARRSDGSQSSASSPRTIARQNLPATELVAAAASSDLPSYTENLRKAGVPDRMVRAIINAEINERFREREDALRPKRKDYQYWERRNNYYENDGVTLEQRLALIDLRREKAALRKTLLGDAKDSSGDQPIPSEKYEMARQIAEDYGAMTEQIRRDARGYLLPSDEEKVRYLENARRDELAQILTPQELREYDLRHSQTSNQLRWDLETFNPNEEEFRAIHELRSTLDREFPHRNDADQEYWKRRSEAEEALNAQLKVVLDEDRYKDYERSQDWEFRRLTQLTNRLGLDSTGAAQLYDLRDNTAQTARQIIDTKDMDLPTKRESLKVLASQIREQLDHQLGKEGSVAYLRSQQNWLDELEQGRVRYKTGRRSFHTASLPMEMPPASAAAAPKAK